MEHWKRRKRAAIIWETDGVESSVAISAEDGYSFVVNGKSDGNAIYDAPTQVMLGMLGAILHPNPTRAAVIGLGTGSSGGWLAAIPSMERVDVFELEPAIEHVARLCAPVNHDALDNPKMHLLLGDAREALLTSRRKYDVIASEPSNPFRAGIASLFTAEYYQAVSSRLREKGVFVQWVQAYEIDEETLSTIYATLSSEFEYVETWQIGQFDLAMVATHEPIDYDVARLRSRIAEPVYRDALAKAWHAVDLEGVLGRFVAGPQFAKEIAESGEVNTDDMNHIEFGFARSLGGRDVPVERLREVANLRGLDKPDLADALDWERVIDGQIEIRPQPLNFYTAKQRARTQAFAHFDAGRYSQALAVWRQEARVPVGPSELALVALGMASQGDDAAQPFITELRGYQPVEASAIAGILRAVQGRSAEAVDLLETALHGYRTDPWPTKRVMVDAISTAEQLSESNPNMAARVSAMLEEPFAVGGLNLTRIQTRIRIAARIADPAACVDALQAFEPHVPWDGPFLRLRMECYFKAGDTRAQQAAEDLAELLSTSDVSRFDADP
jgi:spermidine synthase